jgi:cell division protein FtsI/penicillin-binding protein 2
MNKAVSATMTPGSIFKLVTSAAAIETLPALPEWTFNCTSRYEVEGEYVTCYSAHGEQNFREALANSCNCAFAELTLRMTPDTFPK